MADIRERFARGVVDGYRDRSTAAFSAVSKSLRAEGSSVGHPDFDTLPLHASGHCPMAISFIDISSFTARSFWEDPGDLVRLSVSVLTQVAFVVEQSGGHVLGLRGDGLMAGWGSLGSDPTVDVLLAAAAASVVLDAGRGALREMLEMDGIEPVQLRAGIDHGDVHFVRTGTRNASEVNVIGFAANFAAKCEKYAHSWEVVVGEGAGSLIDGSVLRRHPNSPKRYEHQGERRSYAFFDLAWGQLLPSALTAIDQVAGQPSEAFGLIP